MYPVSDAFLAAVKQNTRTYYWTGQITTTGGAVYDFDQNDIVKGSGYINPILAFVFSHDFHLLPAQPSVQKSAALFAPLLETEIILDQGMYPRVWWGRTLKWFFVGLCGFITVNYRQRRVSVYN